MTTVHRSDLARRVWFHDPAAPVATAVVPSVFVAVRGPEDRLLLVRRCDSGRWELPGGRVDVGESAEQAAVRETLEEAAVRVAVTGLAGVFTDPGHVVRSVTGEVRQQFVLVFHAGASGGVPQGDLVETSEAAWMDVAELPALPMEPSTRLWIGHALTAGGPLHVG
jgi:8-oxo-dGTP pyrophosphatase MutT (NUDIX family)